MLDLYLVTAMNIRTTGCVGDRAVYAPVAPVILGEDSLICNAIIRPLGSFGGGAAPGQLVSPSSRFRVVLLTLLLVSDRARSGGLAFAAGWTTNKPTVETYGRGRNSDPGHPLMALTRLMLPVITPASEPASGTGRPTERR